MNSCAILLHSARDMSHPFAQQMHAVYTPHPLVTRSCLGYQKTCSMCRVRYYPQGQASTGRLETYVPWITGGTFVKGIPVEGLLSTKAMRQEWAWNEWSIERNSSGRISEEPSRVKWVGDRHGPYLVVPYKPCSGVECYSKHDEQRLWWITIPLKESTGCTMQFLHFSNRTNAK